MPAKQCCPFHRSGGKRSHWCGDARIDDVSEADEATAAERQRWVRYLTKLAEQYRVDGWDQIADAMLRAADGEGERDG